MSTHQYTRVDEHGCVEFGREIKTALPGKVFKVCVATDTQVVFEEELTTGEITTLDNAVSAFSPLEIRKRIRADEIDAKTDELIAAGFTYDSVQFALTSESRARIHGAYTARAGLTYPVEWDSIDDTDMVSLADTTDVEAFFDTALAVFRGHVDSGTTLKTQVRVASDQSELDAVVDNR